MLQISEVNIISIDKSEESWAIEGEIIFDDDLSTAFEAGYLSDDDELEYVTLELDVKDLNMRVLKERIVEAANEFDE